MLGRAALRLSDVGEARVRLARGAPARRAPRRRGRRCTAGCDAAEADLEAFTGAASELPSSLTTRGAADPALPPDPPLVPRDRRAHLRLGEHGQDPGQRGLPQARRPLALRGRRLRPRARPARRLKPTPRRPAAASGPSGTLRRRRRCGDAGDRPERPAGRRGAATRRRARGRRRARCLAQRDRPAVLEDRDGGGRARRDRVRDEPHLVAHVRQLVRRLPAAVLRPISSAASAPERAGLVRRQVGRSRTP